MDITMCTSEDCAYQDSCWRLNAPPDKFRQAYCDFKFNDEDFESGGKGCDFYINMEEVT